MKTAQTARQHATRATSPQDYLEALAKRISRSDEAYRAINPLSTFQEGGCWVFAQAVHEAIPGSALLAVSSVRNLVEHVLVYTHGVCLDSDGCASPKATLQKWEDEGVPNPILRPFHPEEAGEVICPPHMVEQLRPLIAPIAAKLPATPQGVCIVLLDTVGNPDLGQDGSRRLPGTRPEIATVRCLEEAPRAVQDYIRRYNLGAGNCPNFQVIQDGVHVAEIAYNGLITPLARSPLVVAASPTRLRQPAAKAPGVAQDGPGLPEGVYDRLRGELNRWSHALASGGNQEEALGDHFRYELFAKRLESAKDGSATAITWALEWHAALTEGEAAQAAARAQATAQEAKKSAQARAELEAGRSGNPIFQDYLDTVEDPSAIKDNVGFFSFFSQLRTAYEKSLEGLNKEQRAALPEDHFTAFRRSFTEARWSDRVRSERMASLMVRAKEMGATFDWHLSGSSLAWIDMVRVPETGKGIGRELYQAWEKALPREVSLVMLVAADTGSGRGRSNEFWEAMGFNYKYNGEDIGGRTDAWAWEMRKGVNGHPTPEPVWITPDEEG